MKATSRYRLLIAGALISLLLLAACGQDKGTEASPSAAPSAETSAPASAAASGSETPAAEQESGKRIYEHALGSTEIPTHPQRVVSIQYTGAMLALGVKPVGADDEWSVYPLLKEEWAGIEDVGDPWTGLNLEKIISLQPDLIVTHVEQTYEQLAKIAPTIFIPWLKYDVRGQIAEFGDILGKQEEAAAWLAGFDAKVDEAKLKAAELIGPDETVAILNIRPKNQFIYGNSAMGGYVIYQALGLKAPEAIQRDVIDQKLAMLEISEEVIGDYASADHVFLSVLEADGGKERAEEIKKSGIWAKLPAVQNNRVHDLDWDTYFTTDPISTLKQLDTFIELLERDRG
jgi:ABC-type Fe3+-hydroxamate transport system, periplasmic component